MSHSTTRFLAFIGLVLLSAAAAAGEINVSGTGGVAIKGADPVAYFTEGRPAKGTAAHSTAWKGATWRFASAANRAAFEADPDRYAPQYGGYCAWAVSQGYTAPIDPEAWKIVGGKLYLNYSKGVQQRWSRDIPGLVAKADGNWPDLRAGLAQ